MDVKKQFSETKKEAQKVSWPKKQELITFTFIVLVYIFLFGLFFGILNSVFAGLLQLIS